MPFATILPLASMPLLASYGGGPAGEPALAEFYHPIPGSAVAVATGDFDGDGDLDLYVSGDDRILVNDGFGLFEPSSFDLPGSETSSGDAAVGDVDGDGDLDVVTTEGRIFLNLGNGAFADGSAGFGAPGGLPPSTVLRDVELADVDGDGALDLWLGYDRSGIGHPDVLLLGDGSGGFHELGDVPAVFTQTAAVALGDVDADGDLDAVLGTGGYEPEQTRLFLNDGSGAFADATGQLPADLDRSEDVALGDVDGDGDLDLVIANERVGDEPFITLAQNRLYTNDGSGVFADATAAALPALLDGTYAVELGDVDGDGDLDLWFGNGRRVFQAPFQFSPTTVGDAPNRLLVNDGTGVFADAGGTLAVALEHSPGGRFADLDGDADLDLVVADGVAASLYLNLGTGAFTNVTAALPLRSRAAGCFARADFDGDGIQDLFVGRDVAGDPLLPNEIWLGTRSGRFAPSPAPLPASPFRAVSAAAGDVDGDGDPDLLVGNAFDGDLFESPQDARLYLNGGAGAFTDATGQLPQSLGDDDRGIIAEVALADLDGDADLDALVASYEDFDGGGGGVDVWVNDGDGNFAPSANVAGPDAVDLAVDDADGDGDLDLLTASWPYLYQLWENDGDGGFTEVEDPFPVSGQLGTPAFLEVADFDGDGDGDAVGGHGPYAGVGDPYAFVWKNDGTGQYAEHGVAPAALLQEHRAIDVDGDGDLDLLGDGSLLWNDGDANFTPAASAPAGGAPGALFDVDLDGDADALLAGDPSRLFANLTRHLAWRRLPAVGQPLLLDVYGPPSEPWALLGATALLPVPVELVPNGLLHLDPTTIVATAVGLLDATGRGEAAFAVPANPAFVGLELGWQAAVGGALALTNLETTLLSGH